MYYIYLWFEHSVIIITLCMAKIHLHNTKFAFKASYLLIPRKKIYLAHKSTFIIQWEKLVIYEITCFKRKIFYIIRYLLNRAFNLKITLMLNIINKKEKSLFFVHIFF